MDLSSQANQQQSAEPRGGSLQTKTQPLTRLLLLCGAIAGPLFIFVLLVQDYTRPGFDPRLDLLSLLSLGDWGWVQIVNFILVGLLNLLYAVGLWRRLHPGRGGTWGPILIGAYGLGLILVGIFRTDPANGFPPGVPAATQPSWHGAIHALGALLSFFCWRLLCWYSSGSSWRGRSAGGLSTAWQAPCFSCSSFLQALLMQHLWHEPYGWQYSLAGWRRPWLP